MNKKKLFTPLLIASSFLIIGCSTSEIVGRPSWIDTPIVEDVTKDNTLKEIYDAIKELGDTNSNVLNKIMYQIAQKQIGHFEDVIDETGGTIEVGLKTINDGKATEDQIKQFIENYPIYKCDEKTYVLDNNFIPKERALTDQEKLENSKNKIKEMYSRIYESIFEKLYNEIKDGSYSTKIDKYFEEDYFVQHLYKEMYYDDYDPETTPDKLAKDRVFIPKESNQKWSEYVNYKENADDENQPTGFINVVDEDNNFTDYYHEYIKRKLLPDIYRTLLIEKYVAEQRSSNLGRSYARKINMIKVPHNDDKDINSNIRKFLNNYSTTKITINKSAPDTDFDQIAKAMIGFACTDTTSKTPTGSQTYIEGSEQEKGVYNLINVGEEPKKESLLKPLEIGGNKLIWEIRTDDNGVTLPKDKHRSTYVYKGTKLYDLALKYLKFMDVTYTSETPSDTYADFKFDKKNHLTSDQQTALEDITNKGAYTIEKGLEIKEREARLTDMTTDGWFLKSSGVSELSDEIKNNLFNINVANIIDKEIATDTTKSGDKVRYFGENNRDKTKGTYLSRKAFLFDAQKAKETSVVLDDDSNFYIVEVQEAVSSSKLSTTDVSNSYLELKATKNPLDTNVITNEITSKVTEQVASGDTYKKNAEQYYLMISNILFYDQSVYDYFKSQFPDLFK